MDIKKIRLISTILNVSIGLLLVMTLFSFLAESAYFLLFGLIVIVLLPFSEKYRKKKIRTCFNCGTSLVGAAYSYQETHRHRRTSQNSSSGTTIGLEFIVECPKCDTTKIFKESVNVRGGENPQYKADKKARKLLGH